MAVKEIAELIESKLKTIKTPMWGRDILLYVLTKEGEGASATYKATAIAGQRDLSIPQTSDEVDVGSKDTGGDYGAIAPGKKEWSFETGGIMFDDDASLKAIQKAYDDKELVTVITANKTTGKGFKGGMVYITDFSLEANHEDAVTYTLALKGVGALVDISSLVFTEE